MSGRLQLPIKPLIALGLVVLLWFANADGAWAARSGGRMGGGSFRSPSRSSMPSRGAYGPSGGGYYPGGGMGFPFLFPLFGFGGGFGGLFTLLVFIAIANFLMRSLRSLKGESDYSDGPPSSNPPVTVAKLQVGLLANARGLQEDLNRIALEANTGNSEGLVRLLQETTLALLRHPDYWMYGAVDNKQTRLLNAEQEFNRFTLSTRSRFTQETLSNVNHQLLQTKPAELIAAADDHQVPGEYIMATLVVAVQGQLNLPNITDPGNLRQALNQIGAIAQDRLLAVEVLWTPQQPGETLSADEMVAEYPDLTLL